VLLETQLPGDQPEARFPELVHDGEHGFDL
jgi:hypothetical protein